ncbi:hypothetical protein GALL_466940 [mine drainage metagenome]|uniref:Uncharacterized protein n=1 Tax=mine drainage metagenome TaxID=410659 RepID=A0A1J5Q6X1_9ZZZZ
MLTLIAKQNVAGGLLGTRLDPVLPSAARRAKSARNVFATGAAHQQAIPAVEYPISADGGLAKRWVLDGTDYVSPRRRRLWTSCARWVARLPWCFRAASWLKGTSTMSAPCPTSSASLSGAEHVENRHDHPSTWRGAGAQIRVLATAPGQVSTVLAKAHCCAPWSGSAGPDFSPPVGQHGASPRCRPVARFSRASQCEKTLKRASPPIWRTPFA